MKNRTIRMAMAAMVMMAAVAVGASASTNHAGRTVSLGPAIAAYLAAQGIDFQYVSAPQDQVPADQAAKLASLATDAKFVGLVRSQLESTVAGANDDVYVKIGSVVYNVAASRGSGSVANLSFSIE
jgi:hypothetical protein